jgi:hypothetical protein
MTASMLGPRRSSVGPDVEPDAGPLTVGRSELVTLLGLDAVTAGTAARHIRRYVDAGAFVPLNRWDRPDLWRFSAAAVRRFLDGEPSPATTEGEQS